MEITDRITFEQLVYAGAELNNLLKPVPEIKFELQLYDELLSQVEEAAKLLKRNDWLSIRTAKILQALGLLPEGYMFRPYEPEEQELETDAD